MNKVTPNLTGVPETMLWTLHSRVGEAIRPDGALHDPKAIEIYRAIDYDYEGSFGKAEPLYANRAALFDNELRAFLKVHPNGVIVNLGEGLETQRFRVPDGGEALWITVDLPESIAIRERFIEPDTRHRHLAMSALDRRWLDEVPAGRPIYIAAQGLLMYLSPQDVATLIRVIARSFPKARFCFDYVPRWLAARRLKELKFGQNFTLPPLPWSINRSEIEPTLRDWTTIESVDIVHYKLFRGLRGMIFRGLSLFERGREHLPGIARVIFA